jgi:putative transposase
MRKGRSTRAQIVAVLHEWGAEAKTSDLVRRHGVTEQTLYRWKKKYGGMQVTEAKRLKALEEANRRLKRLVADQALNLEVVKVLLGKTWRPRAIGSYPLGQSHLDRALFADDIFDDVPDS